VIGDRKVDVTFHVASYERNRFPGAIPVVPIRFGPVVGLLLRWDPPLLAAWKARGAVFEDFPSFLDRYLADPLPRTAAARRADYEKFRRFYFDQVEDPERDARFRASLGPP